MMSLAKREHATISLEENKNAYRTVVEILRGYSTLTSGRYALFSAMAYVAADARVTPTAS